MTLTLLGPLLVLALIDSTSFGTLLIPIWLLLAPGRLRAGRVLIFLGTVAAFYFVVGVILIAGAATFLSSDLLESPIVSRIQLVLGIALFVASFFIGKKKLDENGQPRPSRFLRWRDRAMGEGQGRSTTASLMALALTAAVIEVASMLPYIAAIGLISSSGLVWSAQVGVLGGYVVVMIAPALVLLAARLVARRAVEPTLTRISHWMEKSGGETTAWIVGIVGVLITLDALERIPELNDLLGGIGISIG